MTYWKEIHEDFTEELQEEWQSFGFDYEQVDEWISEFGFAPCDAEFAIYLGDEGCIIDEMKKDEIARMRIIYNQEVGKSVVAKKPTLKRKVEETADPSDRSWKNIELDFTPELVQEWLNYDFSYGEIQDWINIGLQPTDHNFVAWLRDNKHLTSEQVLNHGNLEQLSQEFFTWWQEQQQTQIEVPPKS